MENGATAHPDSGSAGLSKGLPYLEQNFAPKRTKE
jgi:hypothetical protein